MSSGNDPLAILVQEREHILLAELGALLHNIGKLSIAFLAYQRCKACQEYHLTPEHEDQEYELYNYQAVSGFVAEYITDPGTPNLTRQDWDRLESSAADWLHPTTNNLLPENFRQVLQSKSIVLPAPLNDRQYAIGDFIEFQAYKWYEPKATGQRISIIFPYGSKATELLEISHNAASGVEKEGTQKGSGAQPLAPTYWATAFGYEAPIDQNRIEIARQDFINAVMAGQRLQVWQAARKTLIFGSGDTRRTINDVTLWDISSSVASFYKAATAKLLIDNVWIQRGLFEWRILRISFDGLAFLERVTTIGDVLGRRKALSDALERVRHLLEWHYPLGNEIYRDEYGSAFIVPALNGDDKTGNRLHGMIDALILDVFRASELRGELRPVILISEADKKAAVLNKLLKESTLPLHPFPDSIKCWWQGEPADICTVCGVRPQGWGAPSDYYKRKAQERNICHVCLDRRSERAKQWAQGRYPQKSDEERKQWERTIWIDEVADDNGRLALLVGRFDLSEWLGGDMIQTMLVACDASQNVYESKNPSFARIQRVWRTTQQFWQDVQDADIPSVFDNMQQYRLAIDVENSDELYEKLGYYHVYDAELDGRRLSVVWDSEKRQLVTADNLIAWGGSRNISSVLHRQMLKQQTIPLYEPGGYRQQRKLLVSATIQDVEVIKTAYTPAIAILNEPSSFMALVPAEVALDIATKVRERYEQEMSKVCNRLPFFMGLVFFDRRQPLFSALDAGRRMLNLPLEKAVEGRVVSNVSHTTPPDDLQHDHFKCWQKITVKASDGNEQYVWRASTVMGDGSTSDDWYPYVQMLEDENGAIPSNRGRQFKLVTIEKTLPDGSKFQETRTCSGNNPDPADTIAVQHWVHVADLQQGDTIRLSPARFSWLFLDTSTRRFEAGEKNILPLEELKRITALWDNLQALAEAGKLTESTWHALVALLKIKHDEWGKDDPETYEHLAETVLANDGLHIVKDATPTRLMHTFELYSQILKQKLKEDETR